MAAASQPTAKHLQDYRSSWAFRELEFVEGSGALQRLKAKQAACALLFLGLVLRSPHGAGCQLLGPHRGPSGSTPAGEPARAFAPTAGAS